MKELVLTDLVDGYILQELQDLFISKSGIAVGISGAQGQAYTEACTLSDFCERYTKQTPEGKRRCCECDCENARRALAEGRAMAYRCHAGLVDFTAPISINGELYGFIVGGQITTKPLVREEIYALAEELGIDPEAYWEAACKIQHVEPEQLDAALKTMTDISHIISDIAINKYKVLMAKDEIEAAAQMKTDFLANMSHEIRTPMNAVIGMANMALREDLPPNARNYIHQIKQSGKTLLAIINDILDFSKIESGKMDINMAEYSPVKMIEEVANIIITRVDDKNVELLLDVEPNMPGELMGDVTRLKQIITNLANNAVKFTREGYVRIRVRCRKTAPMSYELSVSVEDTGIGIKKSDLEKIFESFQQVDSKRNRNIEGTGLGLAISRQLVSLMNGTLQVESTYDVGSTFSFTVPQLAMREVPAPVVHETGIRCVVCITNPHSAGQLCRDIEALGGAVTRMQMEELYESLESGTFPEKDVYLFVENREVTERMQMLLAHYPEVTKVVLLRFKAVCELKAEHVIGLHKPVYTYSLIRLFNHEEQDVYSDDDDLDTDFTASEARVLIVDDNEVNLAVAEGLLKPLAMQVETATSGEKAIEMISAKMYDLIFMDHMMPKMDGVETTHIIRRLHPEYDAVPIIALTANAMEETKAMFLCEGMNDFLAKPIEVSKMIRMVKSYLPKEKIVAVAAGAGTSGDAAGAVEDGFGAGKAPEDALAAEMLPTIDGINTQKALSLIGDPKLLREITEDYYRAIDKKYQTIETDYNNRDWENYTIEVHALKSSSRQIGADALGEMAASLEAAGRARQEEILLRDTPALLAAYAELADALAVYYGGEDTAVCGDKPFAADEVRGLLHLFAEAAENLDSTAMEEILQAIAVYAMPEALRGIFAELSEAVQEIDIDRCEALAQEFETKIDTNL